MASDLQRCIDRPEKLKREVGFVGILEGNIFVNNQERYLLNQLVLEAIATTRGGYTTNSGEAIGDLAPFLGRGISGQLDLQKIEQRFKSSPFVLILDVKRPTVEIVQLRIILYARSADGTLGCNQTATLNVRLSDYKVVGPVPPADDLVTLEGAYRNALRRSLKYLQKASTISFHLRFDFAGTCDLRRLAIQSLEETYFNFKSSEAGLISNDTRFPKVIPHDPSYEHDGSADAMRLDVRVGPAPLNKPAVKVSISVRLGIALEGRFGHRAVVDSNSLKGCYTKRPELSLLHKTVREARRNGLRFEVKATKNRFVVNQDPVQVDIAVHEPLYVYCYYIGQDETAYIVYPRTHEQASRPWRAGEHRLFPDDFYDGNVSQTYKRPEKELWGCFASRERLPRGIEQSWIDAHHFNKGGSGKSKELTKEETEKLATRLRDVRSVGEHYTWLEGAEQAPSN